jgi:hypothetical protein
VLDCGAHALVDPGRQAVELVQLLDVGERLSAELLRAEVCGSDRVHAEDVGGRGLQVPAAERGSATSTRDRTLASSWATAGPGSAATSVWSWYWSHCRVPSSSGPGPFDSGICWGGGWMMTSWSAVTGVV